MPCELGPRHLIKLFLPSRYVRLPHTPAPKLDSREPRLYSESLNRAAADFPMSRPARYLRFKLRDLLLVTAAACVLLAWVARSGTMRRRFAVRYWKLNGTVLRFAWKPTTIPLGPGSASSWPAGQPRDTSACTGRT